MKKNTGYILAASLIACLIVGILLSRTYPEEVTSPRDYPEIAASGILNAVTEYNAISYHVEDGEITGFDFELLQAFGQAKNLEVRVTPEMSFINRMQSVLKGKNDILATGTIVNSSSKDSLLFTRPILLSKQVLVQRLAQSETDSSYINSQLQLAGKTLYVVKGSPALLRLHHLMEEIADSIYIKEIEQYGPEQLLAMVANRDIDYAVCDESIALASQQDFPNLDIKTDISFTQFYSWGVSKASPMLLDTLNCWLEQYTQTKEYKELCKRYF